MTATTREITEARLQYDVVMWAQENGYFCFHCPNGEKRDMRTANKLLAMGVKPGVPDLIFILPAGKILWVELKLKTGTLSAPQKKFREVLLKNKHHYLLVQASTKQEAVNYLAPILARICHPEQHECDLVV